MRALVDRGGHGAADILLEKAVYLLDDLADKRTDAVLGAFWDHLLEREYGRGEVDVRLGVLK